MSIDCPGHSDWGNDTPNTKTPYELEAAKIIAHTSLWNGKIEEKIEALFWEAKDKLDQALTPILEGYQVKLYWRQKIDLEFVMAIIHYAKQNKFWSFQGWIFLGLEDSPIIITPNNWETEWKRLLGVMMLRIIETLSSFSDEERKKYVEEYSHIFQELDRVSQHMLWFWLGSYISDSSYESGVSTTTSMDIDLWTLKVTQITRVIREQVSRYTRFKEWAEKRRWWFRVKV